MKKLMTDWNLMRIIRLILGVLIFAEGMRYGQWALMIFGGLFTGMSLLNLGCASGRNCRVYMYENSAEDSEVTYEEVK